MIYEYNLRDEPFKMIENGSKTIELRLFDERRKDLKIGDTIIFIHEDNKERLLHATVIKIYHFPNFETLYKNLPPEKYGYKRGEIADYHDMEKYYSPELQSKFSVIGIEIELKKGSVIN